MKLLILCLGLATLAASLAIIDLSQFLKRLGFKEEAKEIYREAIALAILGFIFFMFVQMKTELPPVRNNTEIMLY
jgi:hypothetical protein